MPIPLQANGYERARERLEDIRTQLRQSCAIPLSLGSKQTQAVSEFGEEPFKACVNKIKDYIFAGDCMQVVPSQRMNMEFTDNPLALYRALRTLNPSPYMFYYDFGDFHIVGSSPEILVRRERDDVIVRPIAGTRLRGKTPAEDLANEQDLLSDAKEIAEHVMLIDLGRNDVGRISKPAKSKSPTKWSLKIFPCDAHRLQRRRPSERRYDQHGYPCRHFPGRHTFRRSQSPRHGNHRRSRTEQTRHLRRRRRRLGFQQRHGLGNRHPHRRSKKQHAIRPKRRRHRRRLRPDLRMAGNAEQSTSSG